ncbi:flagellar basal-body MS-ring/collar protein FliF [Granulicella sibirica]|uniref:Flagellar M-ring protein n=1 Tax=Granulicella sibirica TaxID=2479048 RepID=A0A4Q0T3M9_9BACT|nr:flagellar basal-body MS-ring/collar protein FliF [Granulicella sibirica]RXH56618.1 Flagellar M-ring protein FliF [Granulicella sibirica]
MADAKQAGSAGEGNRTGLVKTDAGVPGAGIVAQARSVMTQLQGHVAAIPQKRRTWLLGGLLFVAAGCAGLAWYFQRADWRVLFSGLDPRDVQTVSQELGAAGIPFETTPDGSGVQVPSDMLDKARMEVAAKGMPQTGRLGFELFDKPNWVGSEFDEHVNYQRALEGELEHTIGSLGVVRSARVHLVLPQASLFTAQDKGAKASVVLRLRKASLSQDQADAIRSLVAGAVENLNPDGVTLVDAEGRVNLQAKGRGSAAEADVEQALEAKLVAMLEPIAGRDNVRATVNVSYDEGSMDRTDEVYDPTQSATLTMRKSEQIATGKAPAAGVPGTASNTPAASAPGSLQAAGAATAAGTPPLLKEQLPVYPQAGGGNQSSKEEQGTYGVTRHVVHSELGPGRVRRVTAAVVVNDRQVMDGTGKAEHPVWKPRTAEEMKRFEGLAQAAVGFDEKRGDDVVMSNVSFSSNSPEATPPIMTRFMDGATGFLHTEPALLRTGMMGLVAFGVVMFVLRPVAKEVTAAIRAPVLLASGSSLGTAGQTGTSAQGVGGLGVPTGGGELPAGSNESLLPERKRSSKQAQAMFDHVSDQIAREPAQSTRLLEAWIGAPDGSE